MTGARSRRCSWKTRQGGQGRHLENYVMHAQIFPGRAPLAIPGLECRRRHHLLYLGGTIHKEGGSLRMLLCDKINSLIQNAWCALCKMQNESELTPVYNIWRPIRKSIPTIRTDYGRKIWAFQTATIFNHRKLELGFDVPTSKFTRDCKTNFLSSALPFC